MYKPPSFDQFLYFLFVFLILTFIGLVFVSLSLASPCLAEATETTSSSYDSLVQLQMKLDIWAHVGRSPLLSIPAKRKQPILFLQSIDASILPF
jgi:hypothetical protein